MTSVFHTEHQEERSLTEKMGLFRELEEVEPYGNNGVRVRPWSVSRHSVGFRLDLLGNGSHGGSRKLPAEPIQPQRG